MVVIDLHCAVVQVGGQRLPAVQTVVNGFGRGTAIRHALPLQFQPFMQIFAERFGTGLSYGQTIFNREAFDLAFDFVQRSNALQRLRAHRTQVVLDQLIKLATGMGKTSGGDSLLLLHHLVVGPISELRGGASTRRIGRQIFAINTNWPGTR